MCETGRFRVNTVMIQLGVAALVFSFFGVCEQKDSSDADKASCVLGAMDCIDETRYRVCVGDAQWWQGSCGEGERCIADSCRSIVCEPGSLSCSADNITSLRCNDSGTAYEERMNCSFSLNGLCVGDGRCVSLCQTNGKSYVGCEYFAADLDNAFVPGGGGYLDAAGAQYSVVVSNTESNQEAYVSVTTKDEHVDAAIIPPRGIHTFDLPRRDVNGTVLDSLAYRLSANVPITAYQFNPLENEEVFSNDASLLFPTHALGRRYLIMSREQSFRRLKGFLTVLATSPGITEVKVVVTATTLAGDGIPALKDGDSLLINMEQFDVLNIETNEVGADLSGSMVEASQAVAVFGGSEAANVPNTNHCQASGYCEYDNKTPCVSNEDCSRFITCCADHLEQQMIPIESLGKTYIVGRSMPRGKELDYIRIVASQDDTEVNLTPFLPACSLNAGQWCEREANTDVLIEANKPILVGQFLASEQAPEPNIHGYMEPGDAGIGDPAFILGVPIEQYRKEYVFLAPNKYEQDYLNIIAPKHATVSLDNQPLDMRLFNPVANGDYLVGRFPIADGYHKVYISEAGAIFVYGYDQYVSYGYPGGMNLNTINTEEQ